MTTTTKPKPPAADPPAADPPADVVDETPAAAALKVRDVVTLDVEGDDRVALVVGVDPLSIVILGVPQVYEAGVTKSDS